MILIIDTSSSGIRMALGDAEKDIATSTQALHLPGAAEDFMRENGAAWRDLSAIGVIVGPGSFTGVRLGIAYAKGLSIGLDIPVVPLNAFEVYLSRFPDAFVAIDSGRGDFFCAAHDMPPRVMTIDDVEPAQMKYPKTVGHVPFELKDAMAAAARKIKSGACEPVIPLYMRPHYADKSN
jgi:tRNA threonylcarbamoyl adenosine modification protein YeaZ